MLLVICILLATAAVFGLVMAALYWRMPKTLQNRVTALALSVMVLLIGGAMAILIIKPSITQQWEAINAEAAKIRVLSHTLGGPENYIEYLRAQKE